MSLTPRPPPPAGGSSDPTIRSAPCRRDCHPTPPLIAFAATLPLQGMVKGGAASFPHRNGRACPGHPRLDNERKAWMPGSSPGMTSLWDESRRAGASIAAEVRSLPLQGFPGEGEKRVLFLFMLSNSHEGARPHSRDRDRPSFASCVSLRNKEGAGKAGCPMHPQPRVR